MAQLITVSEYVHLPKSQRPTCIFDNRLVVTAQRDLTFQGAERYVIFSVGFDKTVFRAGGKYPGELLVITNK